MFIATDRAGSSSITGESSCTWLSLQFSLSLSPTTSMPTALGTILCKNPCLCCWWTARGPSEDWRPSVHLYIVATAQTFDGQCSMVSQADSYRIFCVLLLAPTVYLTCISQVKMVEGCKTYSSIEKCSIAPWVSILWCTTLVLPRLLLLREITSEKVNTNVSKEVLSAPESPWTLDWSCLTACFTSSLWDWGCGSTSSRAADSRGVLNGCNTPSF